jgi:hypothetical protein
VGVLLINGDEFFAEPKAHNCNVELSLVQMVLLVTPTPDNGASRDRARDETSIVGKLEEDTAIAAQFL